MFLKYEVPGPWSLAPGPWPLAPDPWPPAPAPGPWALVPGPGPCVCTKNTPQTAPNEKQGFTKKLKVDCKLPVKSRILMKMS